MKARYILALILATAALYPNYAQASVQMGRSDREMLDALIAWRDNPDMPKDSVLAQNAVKQINRTEERCGNMNSDADLNECSSLLRGANKMRDTLRSTPEQIQQETAEKLAKTEDLRAEKGATRVLKPNETGMTKAQARAESSPQAEINKKAKGKLTMGGLQEERQMEQESAGRSNQQLTKSANKGFVSGFKNILSRKK